MVLAVPAVAAAIVVVAVPGTEIFTAAVVVLIVEAVPTDTIVAAVKASSLAVVLTLPVTVTAMAASAALAELAHSNGSKLLLVLALFWCTARSAVLSSFVVFSLVC